MTTSLHRWVADCARLSALLLVCPVAIASAQSTTVLPGVVVETVDVGSAPYRTGLRSGDVLLGWRRTLTAHPGGRATGVFNSPFDLRPFELEESYRGTHVLSVRRAGKRLELVNSQGPWTDITVRSRFVADALAEYERGLSSVGQTYGGRIIDAPLVQGKLTVGAKPVQRTDFEGGLRIWEELASHLSGIGEHAAAGWLRWRLSWEYLNVLMAGSELRIDEAEAELDAAIGALAPLRNPAYVADLHARIAHEYFRISNHERARTAFERALASTERVLPDSPTLASVLHEYAHIRSLLSESIEAARKTSEPIYQRALSIRGRTTPRAVEYALLMASFGDTWTAGFLDSEGKRMAAQAWQLVQKVAPYTPEASTVGDSYKQWARLHGDLAAVEEITRHQVRAAERWSPKARHLSEVLSAYAGALSARGKLDEAEAAARRALDQTRRIEKEWAAAGWEGRPLIDAIHPLTALGDIAYTRGDLAAAEDWYWQAGEELRKRFPDDVAPEAAMGLGRVMEARGDLARASDIYARIARIEADFTVAAMLRLADFAVASRDLSRADAEAKRAESVIQVMLPNSIQHAELLRVRASMAAAFGTLADAERLYRESLDMIRREAAGSVHEAAALQLLGDVQRRTGRHTDALATYRRALAIRLKLTPGTSQEAEARHALARIFSAQKDPRTESEFESAIAALEHQVRRAGSRDQARAGIAARNADIYRDYVQWLLENGRHADAFHVLERSRARSFLASLVERELRFSADVPPHLSEQRAKSEAAYDQLQAAIARANPVQEADRIAKLTTDLHAMQVSLDALANRIQAASPKVAATRYPKPLTASGATASIDEGTVVLSYAAGKDRCTVFILRAGRTNGPEVLTLPVSEQRLRMDVDAFRRLIAGNRGQDLESITKRGRALYDLLLKPAEPHMDDARRLLIIGDGPLLALPFAALVRSAKHHRPEYLVQWKPVHTAMSVTAYAQLRRAGTSEPIAPEAVVAFGDPRYPPPPRHRRHAVRALDSSGAKGDEKEPAWVAETQEQPAESPPAEPGTVFDPEVGAETERGAKLSALPGSREEVMMLARLYGPGTRVYLGADATEERATQIGRKARVIHFAAHGVINDRLPLNSAIALSIPGRPSAGSSNGLLQAWEIYDRMRIDADLVTLSACQTALGREARGEGLMGLTRAFLYAGARSVLASQWRVSDRSTAVLMERFYAALKNGRSKDEALRSAQRHLIDTPGTSHPYYWAAFQLHGGWR